METFASSVFARGITFRQNLSEGWPISNALLHFPPRELGDIWARLTLIYGLFSVAAGRGEKGEKYTKPIQFGTKCEYFGDLGLFVGLFASMGTFWNKIPFLWNGPESLNFPHSDQIMGEIQTWSSATSVCTLILD